MLDGRGDAVDVNVAVADAVALRDAIGVPEGVAVHIMGRVAVCVGVGLSGLPILTYIEIGGPRFPPASRTCTVMSVSPGGKERTVEMGRQNWIVLGAPVTKVEIPNSSTVQARRALTLTVAPQAKSFSTVVIRAESLKSTGSTPGTPPSQTAGSASPRGRPL